MCAALAHVCFVPIADISQVSLYDFARTWLAPVPEDRLASCIGPRLGKGCGHAACGHAGRVARRRSAQQSSAPRRIGLMETSVSQRPFDCQLAGMREGHRHQIILIATDGLIFYRGTRGPLSPSRPAVLP